MSIYLTDIDSDSLTTYSGVIQPDNHFIPYYHHINMVASTRNDRKSMFTHVMENVLEFEKDSIIMMEMKEFYYDSIEDIATMSEDEIMDIQFTPPNNQTSKSFPSKKNKKLLHLIWWHDYTLSKSTEH